MMVDQQVDHALLALPQIIHLLQGKHNFFDTFFTRTKEKKKKYLQKIVEEL
jgi:hypothetical protein